MDETSTPTTPPTAPGLGRRIVGVLAGGSGPRVARLYHRLFGLGALLAFLSLVSQVLVLVGENGLLPTGKLLEQVDKAHLGFAKFPTLFLFTPVDDAWLLALAWIGVLLSALVAFGIAPRLLAIPIAVLYLSFITVGRSFFAFQWDNLLLESALLIVFLPRDRRAPWIHFLFRILLFKLYWESGLAKWWSPIGDWRDGSAMTFYYQTAPIPTRLAWFAHHLPTWWHHLESRIVLWGELLIPLGAFGPRVARRVAFVGLTIFQIVNIATANYGFFCYMALGLHVFLLDDDDLERLAAAFARRFPSWPSRAALPLRDPALRRVLRNVVTPILVVLYLGLSLVDGIGDLGSADLSRGAIGKLRVAVAPFRLVSTYHLFGSVTRQRVEPELQVRADADADWKPLVFKWKPGPVDRPPPFVAPHQPRVDFRLWFWGLGFRSQTPDYVVGLLDRLCWDPDAVAPLFVEPPPSKPQALRVVFWDYRFSTREEHARGIWWDRDELVQSRELSCSDATLK